MVSNRQVRRVTQPLIATTIVGGLISTGVAQAEQGRVTFSGDRSELPSRAISTAQDATDRRGRILLRTVAPAPNGAVVGMQGCFTQSVANNTCYQFISEDICLGVQRFQAKNPGNFHLITLRPAIFHGAAERGTEELTPEITQSQIFTNQIARLVRNCMSPYSRTFVTTDTKRGPQLLNSSRSKDIHFNVNRLAVWMNGDRLTPEEIFRAHDAGTLPEPAEERLDDMERRASGFRVSYRRSAERPIIITPLPLPHRH